MFDAIQSYLPMEWRRTVEFLGAPLWWIPEWNRSILHFSLFGNAAWDAVLRWVFLLLPSALLVVGVWVTMTALYTLPFRARRRAFVTAVFMSWWDAGRSIWFFWAGVLRLLLVLVGWVWGLLRLAGRTIVQALRVTFNSPFVLLDWTSRRYFKPGVPWIAFLLTLGWSALEATIFTYTLEPTLTEVLSNITGFDPNRAIVTPVLWLLLFFLIAGSFACVQVLAQAVQSRKIGQILQMTFVEFFVMFFEVTFLYRELIDAITPWIAQQTGGDVQLGLVSTIALAAFGWVGVRGMTWFLFGRYGTPALLAVLSRETLTEAETAAVMPPPPQPAVFKDAVDALKAETQWFKQEGKHLFELLSLPVLQLLAAAVNFPAVAVRSQPVFTLPFKSLSEVQAATPFAEPISSTRSSRRRTVTRAEPASQGGTA
ncbi:MAG TPA: hypothetical protein VJ992_05020 [Gemmatimonadales bacterium]|nr:hypothetical protein [Gemmatimonadales bacterium]